MASTREDTQNSTIEPPAVQVFTLGAFRVLLRGKPLEDQAWHRKTARQLFKILVTRPGRRATREEITDLLWPESDPEAGSNNLRATLHALRRALEPDPSLGGPRVVFSDREAVSLQGDAELWVDADEFERLLDDARTTTEPDVLLEQASALYNGLYLPADVYEDWSTARREALRRAWTDVQFRLAESAMARSDVDGAALPLRRLLEADPADERAAQELMRLFARSGRRSEALRIYTQLVESLRADLGVEPSRETQLLQQQVAAGETKQSLTQLSDFRCTYPFPSPRELVGREAELATLERVLAVGRTSGQAALIGGPAGAGKSALLGKLVERAQSQGVLCLAGGCYEEGATGPLGPFHDALVDFLLAHSADRIRAEIGSSVVDLAHIIPELRYKLNLIDAPSSHAESMDRSTAFGAIHSCLRSLADHGPVLICLDDVHAADEATLHLLHYLTRQTRRLPVVLVATYRTDEAESDQTSGAIFGALLRERLAVRVSLDSLGREATDRMVAGLLAGPSSTALGDSLYAITGGNPLYVEQHVSALREAGQIQRTGGLWHGTTELRELPHVIRDVIAQRLRRLPGECVDILATAAVLGKSFHHRMLAAALEPIDEALLLDSLDRAIVANVLHETSSGYTFRHVMLREAVYWELSAPRRMLLHRRAGEVLERLYGERADDHAAELAHHFQLAGESDAVLGKAFRYSMQAGRQAAQLSSYPQSVLHFGVACELLDRAEVVADPSERLAALEGRGRAERELARWNDSIRTYQAVLNQAPGPTQRARARSMIAYGLQHTGDVSRALEELTIGIRELADLPLAEAINDRLYLNQLIGLCWYLQGRYHELLRLGNEMLEDARYLGDARSSMLAHGQLAMGYMGLGKVSTALAQQHLRLAAAELTGDKIYQAIALENLGYQLYLGGSFTQARDHLEQALGLYRDAASELRAVNARQHLCRVWIAEGQLDRAFEQTQAALDLEVAGQERWAADGHQILGTIHTLRCNWVAARSSVEAGLRIRERVGDKLGIVESTVSLGKIDERTGEWQTAAHEYERALAVALEMDSAVAIVQARCHLGRLLTLRGDQTAAAAELFPGLELAEGIKETLEFGPMLQAVAAWHVQDNNLSAALALAEQSLVAPGPMEHVLAAHVLLAELYVQLGNYPLARASATRAQLLAQQLEAPYWLSAAQLAVAEAAAPTDTVNIVTESFRASLDSAVRAQAPFARARALNSYAAYLSARRIRDPDPRPMTEEANDIVRQLRQRAFDREMVNLLRR